MYIERENLAEYVSHEYKQQDENNRIGGENCHAI